MGSRKFADYVADYKTGGKLSIDCAVLVLNGDGEEDVRDTDVTAMDRDAPLFSFAPDGGSMPASGIVDRRSLPTSAATARARDYGFVFSIAKRSGNAFDYISVGRTPTHDVVLPLQQISKFHAYFTREASDRFLLADAGSTNGTWIGSKRLQVRRPEPVNDNARVRLGPYFFTFLTPAGFGALVKSRAR